MHVFVPIRVPDLPSRRQGNALFEQGDLPAALAAYDAQLRLVEGRKGRSW